MLPADQTSGQRALQLSQHYEQLLEMHMASRNISLENLTDDEQTSVLSGLCDVPWFREMVINRTVDHFEPQRRLLSLPEIYIITLLYIVIGIVGTLGNLLTIYVILRTSKLRKKIITTLFLCNLAVSDLMLIVIGVPSDVMYMWDQWSTWPTGVFWGNFGCLTKGARVQCARAHTTPQLF
jgi:hypothetical protein